MYITSISISYVFLGVTLISVAFAVYFKTLVIKTSPNKNTREKILGNMKDPITWRHKNNIASYVALFWTILSLCLFIYFKFFYVASLISIYYLYIYAALIVISLFYFISRKKLAS